MRQPKIEPVRIEDISHGAAIERLNIEFDAVLENIEDDNTSPTAEREIILKIKIKPSEDRVSGTVSIQAYSKLAPVVEHKSRLYFGKDAHGRPEASEIIEGSLFSDHDHNVTLFKKENKK